MPPMRPCYARRASRPCRAVIEAVEPRVLMSMYTVTNLADSGPGSLREGIKEVNAIDSGQVYFAPGLTGTITLTSGPLLITNGTTINGPGAGKLTISGNHASKVFQINGFVLVNLSGLTVANGIAGASPGGGIASSGLLDISDCTFLNNSATGQSGGAIFSGNSGYLEVDGCSFANNSATLNGGAIDTDSGGAKVSNSVFTGNSARGTGTQGEGGAIASGPTNFLTVDGCVFSDNSAYNGGALCNQIVPHPGGGYDFGSVHVADSSFSANSATYGGAIQNGGSMGVATCTFYNNSASTSGGAIESDSGCRITCSTIAGNHAKTGGGLNVGPYPNGQASNGELHNSIVAGNTRVSSTAASDISIAGAGILIGTSDLIGTGGGGTISNGSYGNKVGVANPKLGAFGNYGGPTPTIPLLPGSPALDGGSNADASDTWYYPPVPLTTDQRGLPRVFNGTVDIGSYQAQPPAQPGDVNHDGVANFSDLLLLAQHYGSTNQPLWENGDLTGDGAVTFPDLLALAQSYGEGAANSAALAGTGKAKHRRA